MLTPPDGLSTETMVHVLHQQWGLEVSSIEYRAVGFGSHHWQVVDSADTARFVTVDELSTKRLSLSDDDDHGFDRLYAALATASDLRRWGATFVVAPLPTLEGQPVVRLDAAFGIALYPMVEGRSYTFHDTPPVTHRSELLQLMTALHEVPLSAVPRAQFDDFVVPRRDVLELMMMRLDDPVDLDDAGPFTAKMQAVLTANSTIIRRSLERYDHLVEQARRQPIGHVLTHGEPHPGNTLQASSGMMLIDWDTALVAPPERDLWSLASGDVGEFDDYTAASGNTPRPLMMDLYRIRWDLADLAAYASRFVAAHVGNEDDEQSWRNVLELIARLES